MVSVSVRDADAIIVARVTRHGYIVTDAPDAQPGDTVYGNRIPVTNTRDTMSFAAEVTVALSNLEGFHAGNFLAVMQIPQNQNPLAYYLPIRNDVRGIGQRNPLDGRSESFDTNRAYNLAFPLDGFVYLNTLYYYTDPRAVNFGRYLICTQEFGHRFGVRPEITPFPSDSGVTDAGPTDASVDDATAVDSGGTDDAATSDVVVGDASGDVSGDAASDAPTGPLALARDSLLGRGNTLPNGAITNRAHWSYFFHTGGSPMEGNNWMETAPGVFQTMRPTFRFSELDLYLMGLLPASMVNPSFLIAEPTMVPRGIARDSQPEYGARTVTLRGRRVNITINDIIQANGPRVPAYPDAPRDLDVVWVLLAGVDDVDDNLANQFDEAIESCTLGYNTSTGDRGHLLYSVPAGSDAGPAPDVVPVPDVLILPDVPGGTEDASVADVSAPREDVPAPPQARLTTGGCACDTARSHSAPVSGALASLCAVLATVCARGRRRPRRGSLVRSRA